MIAASRRDALGVFFARNVELVMRRVERQVHAPPEVVEDACQHAWLAMLRRDDVTLDARGRAWVVTVAIHAAWKLAARRDLPVGSLRGETCDAGELPEPCSYEPDCEEQALARLDHWRRRQSLGALKQPEREALCLQALGFSHREIADLAGSTPGSVGHRIDRGRRRLLAAE